MNKNQSKQDTIIEKILEEIQITSASRARIGPSAAHHQNPHANHHPHQTSTGKFAGRIQGDEQAAPGVHPLHFKEATGEVRSMIRQKRNPRHYVSRHRPRDKCHIPCTERRIRNARHRSQRTRTRTRVRQTGAKDSRPYRSDKPIRHDGITDFTRHRHPADGQSPIIPRIKSQIRQKNAKAS